jgi:hypothetical protein
LTRRNLTLVALLVLLVLVLIAGTLSVVLERQFDRFLREKGVHDYSYKELQLSLNNCVVEDVLLAGEREGLLFEVRLRGLELSWRWSELFEGRLESVRIQQMELELEESPRAAKTPQGAILLAGFLPRSAIERLPVEALDIPQLLLQYHPSGGEPLWAVGLLKLDDAARLELRSQHRGVDVQLVSSVPAAGPDLSSRLRVAGPDGVLGQLAADLDASNAGTWQWDIDGAIDLGALLEFLRSPKGPGVTDGLDGLNLQGRATVAAVFQHADRIEPMGDIVAWLEEQRVRVQVRVEGTVEQLDYDDQFNTLPGNFALRGELDAGGWAVDLEPAEFSGEIAARLLGLSPETQSWLGIGQQVPVKISVPEGLRLTHRKAERWQLQLLNGSVKLGAGDSELRIRGLEVDGRIDPGSADLAELSLVSRLDTRFRKQTLPQLAVSLSHAGSVTESRYTLALSDVAESLRLQAAGEANLRTGEGRGELALAVTDGPYAVSTILPILANFDLFDEDLEVTSGQANLDSHFTSQGYGLAGLEQTAALSVQGVSGRYGDYQFTDLGLDAQWTGAERWQTTRPAKLSLGNLNLGFELTEIEATANLPPTNPADAPAIRLETFSTQVFGGRLFLQKPATWNFGAASNRLTLEAQSWELSQLVTLQSGQQIEASGLMEGSLPVEFSGGRMVIEEGDMRAVPPGGTISYVADEASRALAGSSDELALALDLLEDFRFDVLSAKVRLDREGQLWLGLSLGGNNPMQFEGRAVNFNINLEQNLDPLLQSLRLSGKLVEELEKGLK